VKLIRTFIFVSTLLLGFSCMFAQEHGTAAPAHATQAAEAQSKTTGDHSPGVDQDLAHASNEAAGEGDEHAEFKESPSVKMVARITGLSLKAAYWLLVIINFLIIAVLVGWALKKNLPSMFRSRTEMIRKSMDEARIASEDANNRLGQIETRLSRLDTEIAEIRRAAEANAAAEENRIRAAAEEDRKKIVETTEQEIAAATRAARRELKAYTADLAVSLAERRINVDQKTDEALVNNFVGQLGKGGR
jgi:F-type H+-transporting ATPase subunit b